MQQYRFIGTNANVGNIRMDRFGQRFNIDEKIGESARKGGVPLLTEDEFGEFNFTEHELQVWADPFMSIFEMPTDPKDVADKTEFLRKRDAALVQYRDIRQGLLDPQSKYVIKHQDGPAPAEAVQPSQPEEE